MIVCQCKVVTDRDIRSAVDRGARTVAQVCRATTAGTDCGSCVLTIRRLLCEHVETIHASLPEVDREAS
ncbi:(2Fe-2S)-binding protein [Raineyella sp. LH-20]|uniref:(2Fe-2S)-binding protein n=1 Tax=Raineyella sp. LH-20 TaxID=3081204 RepID=UPI002952BF39|nr:(2Fe-2S)-binding protein [Raineyella sp. LH-20]WOP18564.1 (2Fe-2S)-binding protein [Raineyella sp. LH-20]